MVIARGRPGLRFAVDAGVAPERFARMDVALFVGFASRGPIDRPVALTDAVQFDAVFGPPPRLAWDARRQCWNQGHLAATVRAFFANGGRRCWALRVAGPGAQPGLFDLPGCLRVAGAGGMLQVDPVVLQAASEGSWSDTLTLAARLQARPVRLQRAAGSPATEWRLGSAAELPLRSGDLLRLATRDTPDVTWFPVQRAAPAGRKGAQPLSLGAGVRVRRLPDAPAQLPPAAALQGPDAGVWRFVQGGQVWQIEATAPPAADSAWAEVLTLELQVHDGHGERWSMPALGLAAGHDDFLGTLPTDRRRSASTPARPLAGTEAEAAGAGLFYLPLGLSEFFGEPVSARPAALPPLARDGLCRFDAGLFLDPELADTGSAGLMARADELRYLADAPRALRGVHAALGWHDSTIGEEVTLLAVPDAVHEPWATQAPAGPSWRWVPEPPPAAAEVLTFGDCSSVLPAPALDGLDGPLGTAPSGARLRWSMPAGVPTANLQYELQAARGPDSAAVLWTRMLQQQEFEPGAAEAAGGSFRVRARGPAGPGGWSPWITLLREPEAAVPEGRPVDMDVALQVHRALLNLCAARMELFAVLALPRDCLEAQALAHARALSTLPADDGRVASFGALYHPWIDMAPPGAAPVPQPPDGAACGLLAACARDRGAWIAPANRLVLGALGLYPRPVAQPAAFVETGINLIEAGRDGMRLLSAETLSANAALRPLQVRRLLMLLRRHAGWMGQELVFEPQGAVLQAAVEQRFEQWLGTLFRRGAFGGGRESEAFRVVVDASRDDGRNADRGQLVVELQVRPVQALQFLQLRLLLDGSGRGDWLEAA